MRLALYGASEHLPGLVGTVGGHIDDILQSRAVGPRQRGMLLHVQEKLGNTASDARSRSLQALGFLADVHRIPLDRYSLSPEPTTAKEIFDFGRPELAAIYQDFSRVETGSERARDFEDTIKRMSLVHLGCIDPISDIFIRRLSYWCDAQPIKQDIDETHLNHLSLTLTDTLLGMEDAMVIGSFLLTGDVMPLSDILRVSPTRFLTPSFNVFRYVRRLDENDESLRNRETRSIRFGFHENVRNIFVHDSYLSRLALKVANDLRTLLRENKWVIAQTEIAERAVSNLEDQTLRDSNLRLQLRAHVMHALGIIAAMAGIDIGTEKDRNGFDFLNDQMPTSPDLIAIWRFLPEVGDDSEQIQKIIEVIAAGSCKVTDGGKAMPPQLEHHTRRLATFLVQNEIRLKPAYYKALGEGLVRILTRWDEIVTLDNLTLGQAAMRPANFFLRSGFEEFPHASDESNLTIKSIDWPLIEETHFIDRYDRLLSHLLGEEPDLGWLEQNLIRELTLAANSPRFSPMHTDLKMTLARLEWSSHGSHNSRWEEVILIMGFLGMVYEDLSSGYMEADTIEEQLISNINAPYSRHAARRFAYGYRMAVGKMMPSETSSAPLNTSPPLIIKEPTITIRWRRNYGEINPRRESAIDYQPFPSSVEQDIDRGPTQPPLAGIPIPPRRHRLEAVADSLQEVRNLMARQELANTITHLAEGASINDNLAEIGMEIKTAVARVTNACKFAFKHSKTEEERRWIQEAMDEADSANT